MHVDNYQKTLHYLRLVPLVVAVFAAKMMTHLSTTGEKIANGRYS